MSADAILGTGRRVGILIERDIDAARPRLVHQPEHVDAASPVRRAHHLGMADVRRQPPLLADRNRFLHALEHLRRLVALMRLVHPAEPAGGLRQLDHLGRRRKGAGHVEEPRAQAEGTVLHALLDEGHHLPDFLGGRPTIDVADDRGPDRSLADEAADVDRPGERLHLREEGAERQRRRSVRPLDDGRDPLPHVVRRRRHLLDAAPRVGVDVDEPRRDDLVMDVNRPDGRLVDCRRDPRDRPAADCNVSPEPRRPGAVHDAGMHQHEVVRPPRRLRRERDRDRGRGRQKSQIAHVGILRALGSWGVVELWSWGVGELGSWGVGELGSWELGVGSCAMISPPPNGH